ncbi:hypothetical protein [Microbulbifer sp.]|uniref:hypothetical protein n=1 Tax=Microbulbifer sp. TaxID=1908541 RepID=UPI003F4059B1
MEKKTMFFNNLIDSGTNFWAGEACLSAAVVTLPAKFTLALFLEAASLLESGVRAVMVRRLRLCPGKLSTQTPISVKKILTRLCTGFGWSEKSGKGGLG